MSELFGINLSDIEEQDGVEAEQVRSVSTDADFRGNEKELFAKLFVTVAEDFDLDLASTPLEEVLEELDEEDIKLRSLTKGGREYLLFLTYLGGNSGGFIVDREANKVVAEVMDGGLHYESGSATGEPWPKL